VTNRGPGTFSQVFDFVEKDGFMESALAIPEPHSFDVRLSLGHRGHVHDYDVEFREHEHDHDHSSEGLMLILANIRMLTKKRMRTTSKNVLRIAA
jgi:nickel/cobalt exporter